MNSDNKEFRVWDKQKKEFFSIKNGLVLFIGETDKFVAFNTKQGIYPVPNTKQKDLGWDRWVLQEYIGFRNNKGDKMYKGDIYGYKECDSSIFEIVFKDGAFRKKYTQWDESLSYPLIDSDDLKVCVKLGNIFENPELMNEKKT